MGRPRVQIKLEIIKLLKEMPCTTHEVCRAVNVHYSTALRNLNELKDLGRVMVVQIKDKTYWKLNRD